MKWYRLLTIRTKLMLTAFLTATLAVTFTSLASIRYDQNRAKDALISELKVLTEVIANRSTAALIFKDQKQALINLKSLGLEPDIVLACIYNVYGEVFIHWEFIKDKKLQCPPPPKQQELILKDSLTITHPITLDEGLIGWLYVEASLASLADRAVHFGFFNLFIYSAALLFAFILARSLQHLLTQSLSHLGETLRNIIQKNDYSLHATKDNDDELGMLIDVTNKMLDKIQQDNNSLKSSEDKFRQLTSMSPVGIFQVDSDNELIYVNSRWCDITGMTESNPSFEHWLDCLSSSDRHTFLRAWQYMSIQGREMALEVSMMVGNYKRYFFVKAAPMLNEHQKIQGYLGALLDISELKQAQLQMEKLAQYDPLTGLDNRRQFREKLQLALKEATTTQKIVAILFMDLDQFKRVNDSLGHDAGDQLLITTAKRLKESVHHTDVVSRIDGDEFTVLLRQVNAARDLSPIADRIMTNLAKPVMIKEIEIINTISMGITLAPMDGYDVNLLMRNADVAMYSAKEKGRNNYQFFSAEMNATVVEQFDIERNLRLAIEHDQFLVYFQPKVRLDLEQPFGAEALLRWQMTPDIMISPLKFIPIAERSGLILLIGNIAFQKSCETLVMLQKANLWPQGARLAINLSAKQLEDPNLISNIERHLRETQCSPEYLECEITESTLMENLEVAVAIMNRLRNLGISLAIDDFGTGYSSLSYLKQLPIDTLKIDQSFIADIPHNANDMAISAAVIAMAHKLHLQVVAEGVETKEQLSFLKANRCEYAQGYYFSKSLSYQDFITYLKNNTDQDSSSQS